MKSSGNLKYLSLKSLNFRGFKKMSKLKMKNKNNNSNLIIVILVALGFIITSILFAVITSDYESASKAIEVLPYGGLAL